MAKKILIKRRSSGNAGPPAVLLNGELAFNEVDGTLYYGKGPAGEQGEADTIIPIAGDFASILKGSTVSSSETATASNDYLVVTVNGQQRAIRLFDLS